jgi:hypothetical protein
VSVQVATSNAREESDSNIHQKTNKILERRASKIKSNVLES